MAESDTLTADLASELAQSRFESVRIRVARHDVLPVQAALVLADDPSEDVRKTLARRDELPVETQFALVDDPSEDVRKHLARLSGLEPDAQMALARDSSKKVRHALLDRAEMSSEALLVLVTDPDIEIVRRAARWVLPVEIIKQLLCHPDRDVRSNAAGHTRWTHDSPPEGLAAAAEACFEQRPWEGPPQPRRSVRLDSPAGR